MTTDVRQVDLETVCGNDAVVTTTLYDGSTGTTPLNLTGATAIQYVVKKQMRPDWPTVLSLTLAAGRIAVSNPATAGIITITFQDTDTLPASGDRIVGVYEHECIVTDASGNKTTVFAGKLTIWPTGV